MVSLLRKRLVCAAAIGAVLAGGATASADDDGKQDRTSYGDRPGFLAGTVARTVYDGVSDDLLTAGLGASGLAFAAPAPGFADPLAPTSAELRRLAIYNNYRALVDTTEGGGYGRLYGPNVDADGAASESEGLIAGVEAIAFAKGRARRSHGDHKLLRNVTMMVQIPESFDPDHACIITAPSSGSRGVYGAIGTAGEWGLKNGCAVAYTDKGTGTGAHNLARDTVGLIDGTRAAADDAGAASTFTARLSDRRRERFNQEFPNRFAYKHAHSELNPEQDWGGDVLRSIQFAFYILNQEFRGQEITPRRTLVIASSVSNGGGASVLAAEQDKRGWIDAVVVSEPNVNPVF
ncbi:MAG: D-(-)-3-hydroxybutyrate oligomer hydrolase, partial [Rhodobacteraceae bacterium]|nr:D-(-)-3-hydroxybutyrate oligomer hydrolase [Paracoccaceae bacterium]